MKMNVSQRVTAASHFDGSQTWPLMQWGYDARGQLASATDASGVVTREYRYNEHGLMVWHRMPGGLESEYRWKNSITGAWWKTAPAPAPATGAALATI
jgi:YD repeat-containing protein